MQFLIQHLRCEIPFRIHTDRVAAQSAYALHDRTATVPSASEVDRSDQPTDKFGKLFEGG